MPRKLTQEEFVNRSNIKHGFKYEYGNVTYVNQTTKVKIICNIHGLFYQRPSDHMRGIGCFKCGVLSRSIERFSVDNIHVPKGSKAIPLTKGKYCIIDISDYDKVKDYLWSASRRSNNFYDAISKSGFSKNRKSILMTRLLMKVSDPLIQVDHINGNTLDNRRCNLRLCTSLQNNQNKGAMANKTSKYKGVYKAKGVNKWRVVIQIRDNGKSKRKHIGYFKSETIAAIAYNEAAKEYHREFARLNIV